jgi:endo-1,3-1,4-beta-glycanase ExoK
LTGRAAVPSDCKNNKGRRREAAGATVAAQPCRGRTYMQRDDINDRSALASRLIVATVAGGLVVTMFSEAFAARRGNTPAVVPLGSFIDQLGAYDTTRWMKADRWTNGSPFANAWRADHVLHDAASGAMTLKLSNRAFLGKPYSSGEYRTKGFHGYGCYEARFKPIRQPGVVTSFFTFAGPYDNGGNGKHNEIDIEFLGFDTTRIQFNFWTNDDGYASHNERVVQLGFDAASGYHNYGFRWFEGGLEWYVDGQRIDQFYDTMLVKTPKPTDSYQKIMMNAWPVDATASGWAGVFQYEGVRLAPYEWVRYDARTSCGFTFAGEQPQIGAQ